MIKYNMSRQDLEKNGSKGATSENTAKILDDFYLYTDREEQSVGRWLSEHGYWESWITSWMTKNIKPGFRCVDIGANYGYYTRVMERLAGKDGQVFAFEANPELVELLDKSILDFPMEDGAIVKTYNVAVADKFGSITLNVPSRFLGGATIMLGDELPSTIPDIEWDKQFTVHTDTVDKLMKVDKVDLIKMDIEGAEPVAWKGMQKTLEVTDTVVIEIGSYSPHEFIEQLFDSWVVTKINVSGEEEAVTKEEIFKLDDLIMAVLRRG